MRKIFIAIVLTLLAASNAVPQAATATNSIEVILSLDGKTVPCSGLKVNLIFDGHPVRPQISGNRILVPKLIQQLYASKSSRYKNNLDIRVTCSGQTFRFPHQYPVAALPGSWEVGIATPPQWFQNFRRTGQIEAAMWLTTLDYACYDCDPGIIVSVTHPDPPSNTVARLQNEQRNAIGETARDDAYALAVYKVDYDRNSLYLLHLLQWCLDQPATGPQEDVCEQPFLDELTNLYWRGDPKFLDPLLLAAASPNNVVLEVGYFYADLLDRRTAEMIQALGKLPLETQTAVCKLAGSDGFSMDSPKLERTSTHLMAQKGETSQRCLSNATNAANSVPARHHPN